MTRFVTTRSLLVLIAFGLIGSPMWAQSWNAISGGALSNVQPANCTGAAQPPYCSGVTYNYPYYAHNVVDAWGGAAADPVSNNFYVWSGGHTDYAGNEVYRINVPTSTVTLLTNPSTPNTTGSEANPDGTPNARHTYDNLVWLTHSQQMFAFGGEGLYPTENGSQGTWLFNPAKLTWTQKSSPGIGTTNGWVAACFLNTMITTKDVVVCFMIGLYDYYQYDVNSDTWTRLTNIGSGTPFDSTIAFDPTDGVSVIVGDNFTGGTTAGIYLSTWSGGGTTPTYPTLQTTTGCSAVFAARAPGVDWDSSINKFVMYPGSGNTVYAYDYHTNVCVPYTFPGGPTTAAAAGTFGRMAYFPSLNQHVLINSFTTNPVTFQFTSSSTTPAPPADSTPPTVSITAPANGTTVTGTVTVSASASDTVAVASVQFQLDGANLGALVTSAPYSVSWQTTTVNTGSHTLTAVAVDTAGNSTTSAPVAVTVSNTAVSKTAALPMTGMGASTLTCIDVDGDGYGVGPGCLGPDADDFDPTVQTAAQAISKWGSIAGLIAHQQTTYANLGLAVYPTPAAIWYVSPTGNDSTCAANNGSLACATFAHTFSVMAAGSLVFARGGTYSEAITMPSGTSTSVMNGIMSYPGELAVLDGSILSHNFDINSLDTPFWYVDGLKVTNASVCINGGSSGTTGASTFHDIVLRHIEGAGFCGLGTMQLINGLVNVTIEYGVYHDNDCAGGVCQHGLYLGSDEIVSSNVTVRRNLMFNNDWNGLHFNGRVTNLIVDQNVSYSNGIAGLDFEMGVSSSFVRSNLVFDNATGIVLYNYPGNCPSQGGTPGYHTICPYDQINNLFENNTVYSTGNITTSVTNPGTSPQSCASSINYCANAAFTVNNTTSPLAGNLGSNTYRNNIFVNYGWLNHYAPIAFGDPIGNCDSTCVAYATTSTFANNEFWQSDGAAGNAAFSLGSGFGNVLSIAGAISAGLTGTNSSWGNPIFVAASPTYSNSPTSFNFRLLSSSPAVAGGASVGVPAYDLIGYTFASPPAIGAYQFQSGSISISISACDLNGDGIVNGLDILLAVNQGLGISTCSTADLQGNGLCTVVDVQRVINASLGGACVTGQ